KLATHLFALGRKRLRHYVFSFDLTNPDVKAFVLLVLPLLAGILVSRWRDAVLVNVQTTQPNMPTYFDLGTTLIGSISLMVQYTLSIALLPFFCDLAAHNDHRELGEVLTKIIRMLVWFFVPVALIIAAAAKPVSTVF